MWISVVLLAFYTQLYPHKYLFNACWVALVRNRGYQAGWFNRCLDGYTIGVTVDADFRR
mgnify:CR=1 FL=1